MITVSSVKEILAWPQNRNGWHVSPNANEVKIGSNCSIDGKVTLNRYVSIGDECCLYDGVNIGYNSTIGPKCLLDENVSVAGSCLIGKDCRIFKNVKLHTSSIIGKSCSLYDNVTINMGSSIGNYCVLYHDVSVGTYCIIGDRCALHKAVILQDECWLGACSILFENAVLESLTNIPSNCELDAGTTSLSLVKKHINALLEVGKPILGWKWVTHDRMSPNFDGGTVIHYEKGAVIEAEGELSATQCAPGLHILPVGVWPEYVGLCDPGHTNMPLLVEYQPEDILFPGNPDGGGKIRVRKLRVLT